MRARTDPASTSSAIEANWDLARTNIQELAARFGPRLLGFGEAAARPALHFAEGMAIFLTAGVLAGALMKERDAFWSWDRA